MKQPLIFLFFLFTFSICDAQSTDTSRVEQYCEVLCTSRLLSTKVTVDIDFGEERKFFHKDLRLKDMEGNLKKFNGVVDALNYMGQQGWVLQNAYLITTGGQNVYHFLFKKLFDKTDLASK